MAGSTVVVEYDGNDITGNCIFSDAIIEQQMQGAPGTFSIRVKDEDQTLEFTEGKVLTITVDGTPLFGGYVLQVGKQYAFSADFVDDPDAYHNRIWVLTGASYNRLLDFRVLHNAADYLHQIPSVLTSVTDGDLIRDYFPNYFDLPAGLDITTFVDDIRTFSKYTWPQQGETTLRAQLEDFQQYTGALVYIDASFNLHHQAIDTTVKRWGFTDKPMTGNPQRTVTASPASFQDVLIGPSGIVATESIEAIVNDAFVWGGGEFAGDGGTLFARATNATSITNYQRWQYAETHFGEGGFGVQDGVDTRANLIVNGSPGAVGADQNRGLKYPQWEVEATWWAHDVPTLSGVRDHIVPGELVTFSLEVFGDPDPFVLLLPMRTVRITFPNLDPDGNPYVQFDGTFNLQPEDPYRLWRFLLAQKKKVTTIINQSVTNTSTAPLSGAEFSDAPLETPDGAITTFTIAVPYLAGSSRFLVNGLLQRVDIDYTESNPAAGEFELTFAPESTDKPWVEALVGSGGTTAEPPVPGGPLQDLIDGTTTGGTLDLTGYIFHEQAVVDRSMTIIGGTIDGDGVRTRWLDVTAADVTLQGTRMQNAALGSFQEAGLDISADNFIGESLVLTGGPYACARAWVSAQNAQFIHCDMSDGPEVGLLGYQADGTLVDGGRYHDNAAGSDIGNEAGGMKFGLSTNITIRNLEADHNAGPGIWLDVSCDDATVTGNHAHHNTRSGIMFEISDGCTISGNTCNRNGSEPGGNAYESRSGIMVSSSRNATVSGNTVAWNSSVAADIAFVSQNRSPLPHNGNVATANVVRGAITAIAAYTDWADTGGSNTISGNTAVADSDPRIASL